MDSFNKQLLNKYLVHKLEKPAVIDKWTFLKPSNRHAAKNIKPANIVNELENLMQHQNLNKKVQHSKKTCRRNRIQLQKREPILQRNRFTQPPRRRLIPNRECINVSESLLRSVSFDVGFLKQTINPRSTLTGNFLPKYTSTQLPKENNGKVPFQTEFDVGYNEFVAGIDTIPENSNKTFFQDYNASNDIQNHFKSIHDQNNQCKPQKYNTAAASRSTAKSLDMLESFDGGSDFRDPAWRNPHSFRILEEAQVQTFDLQFPLNVHEDGYNDSFFNMPTCHVGREPLDDIFHTGAVQNKQSFLKTPKLIDRQKSFNFQDLFDSHNAERKPLFFNSVEFDFSPCRGKHHFRDVSPGWSPNRALLQNDHQKMCFDLSECLNMFNNQCNLEEGQFPGELDEDMPVAAQFESFNFSCSMPEYGENSAKSPSRRASPASVYSECSLPRKYLPCNEILNESMEPNATAAIRSAEREILDPPDFKYEPRDIFKVKLWK